MGCGNSKFKEEERKKKEDEERKRKEEDNEKKLKEEKIKEEKLKKEKYKRKLRGEKEEQKEEKFEHKNPNSDGEFGYEDEIYDGINYGKPLKIFNQVWLPNDLSIVPDTTSPKVHTPVGWRVPTITDYFILFKNLGEIFDKQKVYDFLVGEKFKMDRNFLYVTSTKTHKDKFEGNIEDSWIFKCVGFESSENKRNDLIEISPLKNFIKNNDKNINHNSRYETIINEDKILKDDLPIKSDLMILMDKELNDLKNKNKIISEETIQFEEEKQNEENYVDNLDEIEQDLNIILQKNNLIDIVLYNIYNINTFTNKSKLACKLIANEVLGINYFSDIVGETTIKLFFTIPKLYNISTFTWDFDDSSQSKMKSVGHIFNKPGEYKVKLNLTLFSNRHFILEKNIWIINEIQYGEDEIINGINYGRPVKIGKQVWMSRDLEYYFDYKMDEVCLIRGKGPGKNRENSYIDSVAACPKGWRLPLKKDLDELLEFGGRTQPQQLSFLFMKEGLNINLNEDGNYETICMDFVKIESKAEINNKLKDSISNKNFNLRNYYIEKIQPEKVFTPINQKEENNLESQILDSNFLKNLNNYDQNVIHSLNFRDIYEKEVFSLRIQNDKVFIFNRSTSMNSPNSFYSTRCMALECFDISLGIKEDYFPTDKIIQFNIEHPNIISYIWDFGDSLKNINLENSKINESVVNDNFIHQDQEINNKISNKSPKIPASIVNDTASQINIINPKSIIKNPTHIYTLPGEYIISCKLILFGDRENIINKKIIIYDNEDEIKSSNKNTNFKGFSQVFVLPMGLKYKVKRNDMMHFSYQSVPIARKAKGGLIHYIAFSNITDNKMKVLKINPKDVLAKKYDSLNNPIYLLEYGIPLDIVETSSGLAILLRDTRDENSLFIQCISESGELLFTNSIMQNGAYPIRAEQNQLIFLDSETEKPVFGMNAMHRPYSGRLSFGNGKIMVIFSYTNYFGSHNGEREDHSADTIISYSEDGREVHLISNWSTSHSLTQRAVYDGKYFYTASLGDAIPNNIKILKIDPIIKYDLQAISPKVTNNGLSIIPSQMANSNEPDLKFDRYYPLQNLIKNNNDLIKSKDKLKDFHPSHELLLDNENKKIKEEFQKVKINIRHDFLFANLIEGTIPSDMCGKTSGRFGDITQFDRDTFAIVYSRIPCYDCGEINTKDEFGILLMNSNLKVIKAVTFTNGDHISCIKQTRYGNNLFVMYSRTKKKYKSKYIIDYCKVEDEYIDDESSPQCSAFLVNKKGDLVSKIFHYPICIFSPPDDFETLDDGSVVWAFIDDNNNLNLCFLFANLNSELLKALKTSIFKPADIFGMELINQKRKEKKIKLKEIKKQKIEMGLIQIQVNKNKNKKNDEKHILDNSDEDDDIEFIYNEEGEIQIKNKKFKKDKNKKDEYDLETDLEYYDIRASQVKKIDYEFSNQINVRKVKKMPDLYYM